MEISQEVGRSDPGEAEKPQAVQQAAVTQAATHAPEFPRRPDPLLDTSTRPPADGVVIKERPIEVKDTTLSLRDAGRIEVSEPFESAANRVLRKLDEYANANGAKVEEASTRFSSTGIISRLWSRTRIAAWLRDKFPVCAYDLTREEADGTTRKVCQVRVSQGVFSRGVTVTVPPYKGGEAEADLVEIAMGKRRATGDRNAPTSQHTDATVNKNGAPTKTPHSTAPDFRSALGAEVERQLSAIEKERIALATTRKRLGLGSKASESEIQEMKRFVADIESDLEYLLKYPTNISNVTKESDGTYTVLHHGYSIRRPSSLPKPPDVWSYNYSGMKTAFALTLAVLSTAGMCTLGRMLGGELGFLCGLGAPLFIAIPIDLAASILEDRYLYNRYSNYFRGPLRSSEPGSLGAAVESLHKAGLHGDIRVADWGPEELQVNLKVTYKPTEEA